MKQIIKVGNVKLGDGHIVIQSMTNTKTYDVKQTLKQIFDLNNAGAELVRVSIPDDKSAQAIRELVKESPVPLIGDIHFSKTQAITAIENGISKIRVNPYNMSKEDIQDVVKCCIEYKVPIRVGVNKGSAKTSMTPQELVNSALDCVKYVEDMGLDDIVVAIKSSNLKDTVLANRILAKSTNHPIHIGLTESGTQNFGQLKSSIAIGALLLDGIGDTIRVSLAGNPVNEIYAAKRILQSIGIDKNFVEVIACPTCARTEINVEELANKIEDLTKNITVPLKIAVMGCVVNGIGEGKDADFGVAGGKDKSVIFENGRQLCVVNNSEIEDTLLGLLNKRIYDK